MPDRLTAPAASPRPNIYRLLLDYPYWVAALVALAAGGNGINLALPKLIATGLDAYKHGTLVMGRLVAEFFAVSFVVLVFALLQSVVQTIVAERVARDLRQALADALSRQRHAYIEGVGAAKLLTNLTSDADAVKTFVSNAIPSLVSSVVLIIGTAALLLAIDWQLALAVLLIVPAIGATFYVVLGRVRALFTRGQENIDRLNKVINESILGAALIRVLDAAGSERAKFQAANSRAQETGMQLLRTFAVMFPTVTFVSSLATLVILTLGGRFVIAGRMSLGDFAAFNSYLILFVFPIVMLGFISQTLARSGASYARLAEVMAAPVAPELGTIAAPLRGEIALRDVDVTYGEKQALRDVSLTVAAGSKTAVIGPTAAGKTQLLYLLTGLIAPSAGRVLYDGHELQEYDQVVLHQQIGFVFQDSVLFNMTIRENIAFNAAVSPADLEKALRAAELADFVATLPQGLDSLVSERGTTLSGGQKQRLMLARALASNPRVLLLDDFTARVDVETERRILANVQ
ncbi:MAG: ABC transporter ATP-binding protein, partial [Chloroflexi bacterium]|nr:ABC transporter ATP-binding protein [Chloroflexota bacterium]